jgi:hypothetical protein
VTNLTTEPELKPLKVYDAAGREWTKTQFFWRFTEHGVNYDVEWDFLKRFLGPIRDKK